LDANAFASNQSLCILDETDQVLDIDEFASPLQEGVK